jgi:hypothetical protein
VKPKPYVLVTIYGGVAEVAENESGVEIDILDFDNLKDMAADDLRLSEREWEYLRKFDRESFEFFAPSYVVHVICHEHGYSNARKPQERK